MSSYQGAGQMSSSSPSIDSGTCTAPRGLGQCVKRLGVKGDTGIVSIVPLNPKLCQSSLTWQRIFENPTLEFNILKATMRSAQANEFNKVLRPNKTKLLLPLWKTGSRHVMQPGKAMHFLYIATKQCSQCCVPAGFLKKLSVCCIFGDHFLMIFLQLPSMLHLSNSTYDKAGLEQCILCTHHTQMANLTILACMT